MSDLMCAACGIRYAYDIDGCTFCGNSLTQGEPSSAIVLAVTQVDTPSTGHEDAPYWCALAEGAQGAQTILKFDRPVEVGDEVSTSVSGTVRIYVVGIAGSGVMARGLAEMLLFRGHSVVWVGRSIERLESARDLVADRLSRVMDDSELDAAMSHCIVSPSFDALATCDVVVEAVIEELAPKHETLLAIERELPPHVYLATNTSSLPLDALSEGMRTPERFGGLHFFNPPTRMRLVEVVRAPATVDSTEEFLSEFARVVGKVPVRVAAGPGFVVNRVLMPLLNEAVRALEDGIADAESIDEAVRLGLNHPMGPLALADLIGLDVVVSIMEDLHARLGDEAYAPRPMLLALVAERRLGRKTGRGFYEYA